MGVLYIDEAAERAGDEEIVGVVRLGPTMAVGLSPPEYDVP